MIPEPPPGQGPIDPRGAFVPPAPPRVSPPMPQAPGGAPVAPAPMPGAAAYGAVPSQPAYAAAPQRGLGGLPPVPSFGPPPPMPSGMPPYGPPPRKRGGVARALMTTLVVIVLIISLGLNILLLTGGFFGAGGGVLQIPMTSSGDFDQKVAVVPLRGIIDEVAAMKFAHYMTLAKNDKNVKAVVIEIDSPGGTVTASDEIFAHIGRFKREMAEDQRSVPVVVSMGSMATSGGYYAACAADYIFAQETTLTGNIGVLLPRYNFSKLADKYGVEETTIVSSGATYKNAGSPFEAENAEDTKYLQGIADSMFARFKTVVQQGRSGKLQGKMSDIANGKAFDARDAKKLGLVDDIGYLEDAAAYAAKQGGLGNPMVFKYQDPPSLLQKILAADSNVPSPSAGGTVVNNGVYLNVDANLIDQFQRLNSGRPMYLHRWPSE